MTDSKIIEQIRQLLRIASDRGASINERELAQRRAERLMVRHRIETLPEGDARARDEDVTSIKVEIKGSSSSMARAVVDGLATLARALSCFCSWRTYRRHIVATIVGTRSDLAYVTEFYNAAVTSYPSMLKDRLRTADFRAEAKACEGRNIRFARDLMIDRDGEAGGQRDGYASGIGWMGERLDGPRVGIAAS